MGASQLCTLVMQLINNCNNIGNTVSARVESLGVCHTHFNEQVCYQEYRIAQIGDGEKLWRIAINYPCLL